MVNDNRIIFVLSDSHYLYKDILFKISKDLLSNKYYTIALVRSLNRDKQFIETLKFYFSEVIVYGSDYYNYQINFKNNYFINKYHFIKAIKSLKEELLNIINSLEVNIIITFDSFDIANEVISVFKKDIRIYYLQTSTLVAEIDDNTLRQKFDNFLCYIFCGFKLIRTSNNPPFNNKNLNYILWTKLWANNINKNNYKINYLPMILSKDRVVKNYKRIKIKNVLVILNKKRNIGLENWKIYANFYKSFFKENKQYTPIFKVHPAEDYTFCSEYFSGYKVLKGKISLDTYDLVLAHWSTFIFDAALNWKPFILINPKNSFDFKKWRLNHYPLLATEKFELSLMINKLEDDNEFFEKTVNDFLITSLGDNLSASLENLKKIILK